MNNQRKTMVSIKRSTLEQAAMAVLFLLALVLFHFANKASVRYQQLYEKSTGKKVE
ncbi:MAG: hypothetical protein JWP88_1475 [Flaviaesturariibacter sp.]|nr:hypothetical protein [Flaviaesturariibacter sp.]